MARTNGPIQVWHRTDTIPSDAEGGYAGGDSTAAAVGGAMAQAGQAVATVDNLSATATALPPGASPTVKVTGPIPNKVINIGVPRGADGAPGMGYEEGQQLLADSHDVKTQAQSAATSAEASATLAGQAQAAALEVPDDNVSALVGNPVTQTYAAVMNVMPAVDVAAEGCVMDGTTDNAVAFQAAADKARDLGKPLHIPDGELYWTGRVYVYTDVTCDGVLIHHTLGSSTPVNDIRVTRTIEPIYKPYTSHPSNTEGPPGIDGMNAGSSSLTGTGGIVGAIRMVSNDSLIIRNGAAGYSKRETSVLAKNGTISPPLDLTHDPETTSIYMFPQEPRIRVQTRHRLRGTLSFSGLVMEVKRSDVDLHTIIDNPTDLQAGNALIIRESANVDVHSPSIEGFDPPANNGYGIAIYDSVYVTINNPSIRRCRHPITGTYNRQVVVNGGHLIGNFDQHWCSGVTLNGVTITVGSGASAVTSAGWDMKIVNCTIVGGRNIFGIRADAASLGGRVIIRDTTWIPGSNTTLWGVGYSFYGTTGSHDYGRPLHVPDVTIDGLHIDGRNSDPAAFCYVVASHTVPYERDKHWGAVIRRITSNDLNGFSAMITEIDGAQINATTPATILLEDIAFTEGSTVYIQNDESAPTAGVRLVIKDCTNVSLRLPDHGMAGVYMRGGDINLLTRISVQSGAESSPADWTFDGVEFKDFVVNGHFQLDFKNTTWSGAATSTTQSLNTRTRSVTGGILRRVGATGAPTHPDGYRNPTYYQT